MKSKPKSKVEEWRKENKAAMKKLDKYKEEEASFMKEENNGSKRAKLKKL